MNDTTGRALVKGDDAGGAADRAQQLRQSIEQSRRQVGENLERLQREVSQTVDVQGWVEDHPWETVGIAFTFGFYLGFR